MVRKFNTRGHNGKIISASSVTGHNSFAMLRVDSTAKFVIRGVTQAAAIKYSIDGITVKAYCSAIVGTICGLRLTNVFPCLHTPVEASSTDIIDQC
jgi:NAD(P)-dependent dehydrogenase (short-subunit alcohol dehydrogenase family)